MIKDSILKNIKESAVLVLKETQSDSLILTKRSDSLRVQPGEICFPGGVREAQDKDLYATALRELEEEIGISFERIQLIRSLAQDQSVFHSVIYPWYARIDTIEPYQINHSEVDTIIKVPMREVLKQENYENRAVQKYGIEFETTIFKGNRHFIWGVTARIMKQLLEV